MKTQLIAAAKVLGMVLLVVLPGGSLVLLAQALLRWHRSQALATPSNRSVRTRHLPRFHLHAHAH